jgi:serine protease Do
MPSKTTYTAVWLAAVAVLGWPAPVRAQEPALEPPAVLADMSEYVGALTERVGRAVVEIYVTAIGPIAGQARGVVPALGRQRRGGSGVIVSADGYIVTNNHVVEGARQLDVVLAMPASDDIPGRSLVKPVGRRVEGRIVGTDLETDLAVIKIEDTGLPYLELGDSDEVRPGNIVFAFGSPLGLEASVTMGVVSAVGRQLEPDHPMAYIQTDAPINPGNSGGPLVNARGHLVGINTLILSQSGGSEGIGFASPSNIVRAVFEQIQENGRVRRGVIGVNAQTITPALAAGLRLTRTWGVVVSDVYPRSPAARAGLQVGDVIVSLDGKPMENARQFDVNVYQRRVGDIVALEVRRGLNRLNFQVAVAERANDPSAFADVVGRERNLVRELGILAVEVDDDIAAMLPWLRRRGGVAVAAQAAGVPSVATGLEVADVIHAVNGQEVVNVGQLSTILGSLERGDAVVLHVDRRGELQFIVFEME